MLETAGLNAIELSTDCHQRGLDPEQVESAALFISSTRIRAFRAEDGARLISPDDRNLVLQILDETMATSVGHVTHRVRNQERQRVLLTCNEAEFAALPPGQFHACVQQQRIISGAGISPNGKTLSLQPIW